MLPNSVLNTLCSVSVSTNVPAMKVTPKTIASAVRARRSLCANRPLTVTVDMSGAHRAYAFEYGVGRRRHELVDHLAVGQEDHSIRIGRAPGVVGDHDDRLVEIVDGATEKAQHLGRRIGVQVAGGLVSEDQIGVVDERPGAGAALLLAARQLAGPVGEAVGDPQLRDQVVEPLPI